jgi:hypothetical protein
LTRRFGDKASFNRRFGDAVSFTKRFDFDYLIGLWDQPLFLGQIKNISMYKDFGQALLPDGISDYYYLTDFKKKENSLSIYIEEKPDIPSEYRIKSYCWGVSISFSQKK